MRTFFNIIKKIISGNNIRPLGRWNIDYCNIKINNKIDLSNEDHCGTCGQYAISKLSSTKDIIIENKKEKAIVVYKKKYENPNDINSFI